jgi:hypothetical protein
MAGYHPDVIDAVMLEKPDDVFEDRFFTESQQRFKLARHSR